MGVVPDTFVPVTVYVPAVWVPNDIADPVPATAGPDAIASLNNW